jgi:hypothetical protein
MRIAGVPLFGCFDIPALFDEGIVEEGHESRVVLAACVDVLVGGVLGLVALVVDVVQ